MKAFATFVLLVVGVGLVLFLIRDRQKPGDAERELRRNNVFVLFAKDQIREIELVGPNGTLRLTRGADGTSKIIAPIDETSDPSEVDALLGALELANTIRVVGDSHPSMQDPMLRGSIAMGGAVVRFWVGGEAPNPEGAHYFQVEGEKVVVVGKEFVATLLRGADSYREKNLISFSMNDVERIEVGASHGERVALRAIGNERFSIEPTGLFASRSAIERMAHSFAEMRALRFLRKEDSEAGERNAPIDVQFDVRQKGRARLLIGAACPGYPEEVAVVRTSPSHIAACVPMKAIDAFRESDWVERAPLTLHFDEIEEVRIDGEKPFEAVRVGGGWRQRIPDEKELDAAHADNVASFVIHYTAARAESVAKTEPLSEGSRLTFRGHDRTETLLLLSPKAAVFREGDGALLSFGAKEAAILAPSLP